MTTKMWIIRIIMNNFYFFWLLYSYMLFSVVLLCFDNDLIFTDTPTTQGLCVPLGGLFYGRYFLLLVFQLLLFIFPVFQLLLFICQSIFAFWKKKKNKVFMKSLIMLHDGKMYNYNCQCLWISNNLTYWNAWSSQ